MATRPYLYWIFGLVALALLLATVTQVGLASPLGDAAREAKTAFEPVAPEQVAAARDRLAEAAVKLETFLRPGSDKGERWKTFLKWQGVQQQLDPNAKFASGPLLETLAQLRRNENGLELAPFRQAAAAIENYANVAAIAEVSDQSKYVEGLIDQIAGYLDRHAEAPTPRSRYEIERRLYLLENLGAVPEFIARIRSDLGEPNALVEVDARLLARLVAEPVDDVGPVTDCILGTSITGTGYTRGVVRAETKPSSDGAAVLFVIEGTTDSNTVGINGPVAIRSDGTTTFRATKQVTFTDETFWNYPAVASATTNSVTRSVKKRGGGLGSRIIESIARDRVAQQKPQADAIAADHAEARIARSLDDQMLPRLRKARGQYEREFQTPLARVNAKPNLLKFSSTSQHLLATARVNATGELAADSPPPAVEHAGDVTLRLHESAPANFLSAWIGGATLSQTSADNPPRLDVNLPDWLEDAIREARDEADQDRVPESADEFKPWSVRFRRQRPVSIAFADGQATVTIHAARIQAGDDSYDNWDVSATYQIVANGGTLLLMRQGEIDVIPSAFDPADGRRLSNRQVGLRGNLAREINRLSDNGRGFPESAEIGPLDLSDRATRVDLLLFEHVATGAGWLSATLSLK
jgi:hypothetical protein